MNPIPQEVLVPPTPVLWGYGRLIVLPIVILALLAMYARLVRVPACLTRSRERLRCPVQLRPARVVFELGPDGTTDVVRCSLARRPRGLFFGRRQIICGKACQHRPAEG
ncbi:MAG TPA: hypothetical protein VE911_04035 [Candidatus Nitrosopolaris sp.]|nr:hypothetical protein [Candidatus Nitrosopolaris sp.]